MEICIFSNGTESYGGSTICEPIAQRLEIRLGVYGPAIESIELYMVAGTTPGELSCDDASRWGRLPRKNFNRKKKRLKGHFLYQSFCQTDEDSRDFSVKKANQAIPEVIQALEYLQDSVRPSDDFAYDAFLNDVRRILKAQFSSVAEMKQDQLTLIKRMKEDAAAECVNGPLELSSKIHTFSITVNEEISARQSSGHADFINQFTCIGDWFELLLRNQYRGAIGQLFTELSAPDTKPSWRAEAVIGWPFDFDRFAPADDSTKRRLIAETMRDAIVWFAENTNQNHAPIEAAFREIEKNEFVRKGHLKTSIPSPNGKLVARLGFEHKLEGVELFVTFTKPRSKKSLGRAPLGLCPYRPWLLGNLHKFASWKRNDFNIDVPPSANWSASVDWKKVVKDGV